MTTENTPDDQTLIRGTINARANAIRSKNAQGILCNFAQDSVRYFLEPPLQHSPLKEDLAGWFATWRGPVNYEIGNPDITIGNDVAYCHSLNRLSGARTDGQDTDIWFRETLCFRKIDDQWLITHLHESFPMYMDGSSPPGSDRSQTLEELAQKRGRDHDQHVATRVSRLPEGARPAS